MWSYNPDSKSVWAVPRSLATTKGITKLFSSPSGTKMFQFPELSHHKLCIHLCVVIHYDNWVAPFGYLRICAYLRLPEAFRR